MRKRERSLSSPSAQSVTTISGKALLRLPAFYAVFLLISSSDLLSFTTTGCHRCGVTVVIPQVRMISLVFLTVLFSRDCSRRSDQAEGFIYTEPQFLWWDLAQPTISGLVPNRRAVAPYASPLVWTWAALINARARLSTVSSNLTASKLSSGWTGPSSETIRWSLFASYLFIICRQTLWWKWWKLGWFDENNWR